MAIETESNKHSRVKSVSIKEERTYQKCTYPLEHQLTAQDLSKQT